MSLPVGQRLAGTTKESSVYVPLSALSPTAEQRAACTPDLFRLCSQGNPNIPRIVARLKQQRPNLSLVGNCEHRSRT
jgi:hypothetical protein